MKIFIVLSVLCIFHAVCGELYFSEVEELKDSQKAALQKFKASAVQYVPHDWMKEDIFLVKFLHVAGYSVKKAEALLKDTIKWREDNKVDDWLENPELSEFEKDYPFFLDASDKKGRPVLEAFFGDWPVRAAAVAGKIKRLSHYALREVERATRKIRELQAEGKNVTTFTLLVNMENFNLINQGCPTCLPLYLGYFTQFEKHYPKAVSHQILVNTPDSFEVIFSLIRPLLSAQTRAALKVFGTNRNEWKPFIDKLVDPSQVSDWFEGVKIRKKYA